MRREEFINVNRDLDTQKDATGADDLATARAITSAVVLSVPFWILVGLCIYAIVG